MKTTVSRLDMQTPDLTDGNIDKIATVFPQVITEREGEDGATVRAVDFDLLRQALAKDLVDDDTERYRLDWPGKKRALLKANTPIQKTLRPVRDESVDFDTTQNLFIEGDNFDALKILQESYLGKVKMIYIDPPYNTGKDFVYKDNFKVSKDEYEETIGAEDEEGGKLFRNTDTNGRFHSDWLSMMYERLIIARDLLRDDGVIFISIDDNEVHNLRKVCDEVFGESNFVAQLIWNKQHSQQQGLFKVYHEYILVYLRNKESIENIIGGDGEIVAGALKKVSKANPESEFMFPAGTRVETKNDYELSGTYGDNEKVTIVSGNFIVRNGKLVDDVVLSAGWTQKNQMKSWYSGLETIDSKGQKVLEFYFNSEGKLKCRKERSKITPPTILPLFGMVSEQTAALKDLLTGYFFENPKPVEMLRLFASWFSLDNDIILDFFSGSATTAHAVMAQNAEDGGNRKFIMVQIPEATPEDSEARKAGYATIADIGKERIRRAGKKIREENADTLSKRETPLDTGFRVFKVDSTNMKDTFYHPSALKQESLLDTVDTIKADRTPEDILAQVMLDLGLTLDLSIETRTLRGNTVYVVAGNALVACFDAQIDFGIVDDIAAIEPLKIVFRDSSFATDQDRINLETRMKRLSPDTIVTVL